MRALLRYQSALLFRSQRWLPPVLLYAGLVAVSLDGQASLGDQLGWNAAVAVPALAWLSRLLLAADPPAARACLAAAAGPRRPHYAALAVALLTGLLLILLADLAAVPVTPAPRTPGIGSVLLDGLATGAVCALTGSALGACCAPPLVRGTLAGVSALLTGSVVLLVLSTSPANAAVRDAYTESGGMHFPWLPLPGALALAVGCWWLAGRAAAHARGAEHS
jgi:hypothetical protein